MLRIYTGGGTADKERFIFDNIDPHRKTIVIVPDQFSLQTERDAFRLMGRESLTDLMIVDFSVLGHKIVHEVCGREPEMIDKLGRHMLLSVIIEEMGDGLEAFDPAKAKNSFVDHMNTMISELKRYEIGPDRLEEICTGLGKKMEEGEQKQTYLSMKLNDILKIYRAYEDHIDERYSDSEDYITYYSEKIRSSETVKDAAVWIYGFDTFTPKHFRVITELIRRAGSVSVVLTGEDEGEDPVRSLTINDGEGLFDLTGNVIARLVELACEAGSPYEMHSIDTKRETIWDGPEDRLKENIVLATTGDHYHESERAAAYIRHLVRDEGMRYGEIAVICNDSEGLAAMLTRALRRMDIPVFADRKRHVLHQPVVSFLLSLLDVIHRGYGSDGVMGMVKSGLLGWTSEQESLLENYVKEYRITSGRWKEPFVYNADRYSDSEMEELNGLRSGIVDACERAKDSIGRRNTAAEKVTGLYEFLRDDMDMPSRIKATVRRQSEIGLAEGAAETARIWNSICDIFDQIIKVIGERRISNGTLEEMIRAGLTSIEMGMIPMSSDCVMIGTLQRSRPGRVKALVIVGAEEGLLPLHGQEDGLLTRRELDVLSEMDLELARKDAIAAAEEQLAIYRMCSLPSERLYVSCSRTGAGQTAARPSAIFNKLKGKGCRVLGDLEKDDLIENAVSPRMTISYLAEALREGKENDPGWKEMVCWYEKNDPGALNRVDKARNYGSRIARLDPEMSRDLYMGDAEAINVSASRLEKYGACPFAHFISYGLRPMEQRLFEVGGREIGDVYHECIMEYCRSLTGEEGKPDAAGWNGITKEECGRRIGEILGRSENRYRDGVFGSDEENRFRLERISEICADIAWAITQQIRHGQISSMRCEEGFGRGEEVPATEFDIDGRKFRLTGTIDRMDTMGPIAVRDGSAIRVIDYKTGSTDIDTEEIRKGYQLQLAIYMDAAKKKDKAEPAGIFYFRIKEFVSDTVAGEEVDPEKLEMQIQKSYRLEGVAVNDPEILGGMDEGLTGGDKYESSVVPVKYDPKKEEFVRTAGGELMSGEEFSKLIDESMKQAERICRELYEGEIRPKPHRTGKKDMSGAPMTACTYCKFGSICMHDRRLNG